MPICIDLNSFYYDHFACIIVTDCTQDESYIVISLIGQEMYMKIQGMAQNLAIISEYASYIHIRFSFTNRLHVEFDYLDYVQLTISMLFFNL
jgi:hypothetical protein